jgi:uncharacterized phosphosugar-binding protein
MTAANDYLDLVVAQVRQLSEDQSAELERAATWIADALADGHRIWVPATSHVLHTELVLRAGGLAAVHQLGRAPDLAHPMYGVEIASTLGDGRFEPGPEDVALVGTNAGTDAGTVEIAAAAQRAGCRLIALTCLAYEQSAKVVVEHESGRRLIDIADLIVDIGCPEGDAVLMLPGMDMPIAPTSGVILVACAWAILARAAEILVAKGLQPLVYRSVQLPGGEADFMDTKARYERTQSGVAPFRS